MYKDFMIVNSPFTFSALEFVIIKIIKMSIYVALKALI